MSQWKINSKKQFLKQLFDVKEISSKALPENKDSS